MYELIKYILSVFKVEFIFFFENNFIMEDFVKLDRWLEFFIVM